MSEMIKAIARLSIIAAAIVFFIFVIGYGFFMGIYHYTSRPEYCRTCHYIEPYVVSWEKSPHKSLKCMVCHEPTGPMGKMHSKFRGLNYYLIDKTGNSSETFIEAPFINERRCFTCHIGDDKDYPYVIKITKNEKHLQYIENEQKCTDCHKEVGHEVNIGIEKLFE